MHPSSELCRAQQQLQLDRARTTALANVRRLATTAAEMWSKEAVLAEKREKRQANAKLMISASFPHGVDDDEFPGHDYVGGN
jgi:hypothetical protein